jgi:glycerol-3-phosphate acyltransferase PlsY
MPWALCIAAGFLAGTIPFGLLIARAKGIDIRTVGSGNIGATNVGRALGKPYFFLCFALDFLKGFAPTLGAGWSMGLLATREPAARDSLLWLAAMLAPVLGHVFNPWLKFKGGKGVATALGTLLAVWPHLTVPALGAFAMWGVVLAGTRYMSLASMVAGAALPGFGVLWWSLRGERMDWAAAWPFLAVSVLLALLVVWTHRANIRRLLSGTELRAGQRVNAPKNA